MTIVTAGPGDPLYEFGRFLADPTAGRLYHAGEEVPLTPKCFKVLIVLVEVRGQRVDKDELFRQVWPDTFVEQNNLARTISMIRKALHERDADEEFIVTIPGRGYRFAAPVRQLTRADKDAPRTPAPDAPAGPAGLFVPVAKAGFIPRAAAVAAIMVCGAAAWMLARSPAAPSGEAPGRKLWQLTSTGRLEGEPTWSPDGRRVAYSSDRSGNFDIWVQPVGGGTPAQITSGPARDWQPSWSPDGRAVAFRSERDGGGLYVVSSDGGGERRISTFGYDPRWSPDGKTLLFRDSLDAYVVGQDAAGPSRVASEALAGFAGRFRIAWHPDGRRLSVYGTDREHGASFWTIATDGGRRVRSRVAPSVARRLQDAGLRLGNFAWSPEGDSLYFEGRSEGTENLWRITVDPRSLEWIGGPERLTTGSSLESGLSLSPDGTRLAFGSRVESTIAWSLPFDPVAGRITGTGEPITPDGANAEILDMSPDGRQLVYRVNGRNRHELWIRSIDRRADRLRTVEANAAIIQPRWSRDGTQLAYLRRPSNSGRAAVVLLAADDKGGERVLTPAGSPEMVYDWSADGQSLLVRCRTNSVQSAICRMSNAAPSEREMRVIAADAHRNLYSAKHSPDERWVSFIAAPDPTRSTVFVSPADGGAWIPITDGRYFEDKPRWSPDGRTLYFLSNRTGFWNLWGRRFDSRVGTPAGDPFQVSRFDSTSQMIRNLSDLQIAITRDQLILPITESSGAIWVLENVDR